MKRMKSSMFSRFASQLNFKLFRYGFIAIISSVIFYACSNEEISTNGQGSTNKVLQVESKKNSLSNNANFIQENVNSFSEQVFVNIESLEVALNKNSYVGFNTQAMQMLNAATSENDLKVVFEMAGIANSQEIIDILKNNVAIQEAFIIENPSFYNLSVEKQMELLNGSIELAITNYETKVLIPSYGVVEAANCASTFNKTIDRCAGDFGICAVFAVAGAYVGLAPGLLQAAYCMVSKVNCDSRAKQDYKECVITPFTPGGPPPSPSTPPTGVVTIHCDPDSCWTTDSNGKFVERIN